MKKKCSQCGKIAVFENDIGVVLCLECSEKYCRMLMEQNRQLINKQNNLIQAMEITAGMPLGSLGRESLPPISNPINNTININKSVVGTVNTGYVKEIYTNLENINQSVSNDDINVRLIEFVEELTKSDEVKDGLKSELLEKVIFLTEELKKGKGNRKRRMISEIIESISKSICSITSLYKLFEPIIQYFNS